MKASSRIAPWRACGDLRPLVLLVIGLLVVILHLCQFPPVQKDASPGKSAQVVFAWLDNQPDGEGLYRLPTEQVNGPENPTNSLPNRLHPLFFQPVAVNQADQQLLAILPGIGPILAGRIVKLRQTRGNYKAPHDLLAVTGIGAGKLKKIRNLLVFDK